MMHHNSSVILPRMKQVSGQLHHSPPFSCRHQYLDLHHLSSLAEGTHALYLHLNKMGIHSNVSSRRSLPDRNRLKWGPTFPSRASRRIPTAGSEADATAPNRPPQRRERGAPVPTAAGGRRGGARCGRSGRRKRARNGAPASGAGAGSTRRRRRAQAARRGEARKGGGGGKKKCG